MRRMSTDDGAVAVIVALLAVSLFGFAAIVVDIGALYAERRELQNGADAGALAVVDECLRTDCSHGNVTSVAGSYAGQNASDLAADATVCGNGDPSWTISCTPPEGMPLGARYARVRTTTRNADDSRFMPALLGGILDADYTGATVVAESVVLWGSPPRTGKTLPLIISACEWMNYTTSGTNYAPLPSYTEDGTAHYDDVGGANPYPVSYEAEILTQGGSGETCKAGGGFNDTIPGGFGWLKTDKECDATISSDGDGTETVDSKQGFNPCVKQELAGLLDEVVQMPIFAEDPSKTTYTISGWASFYITGYCLNGNCDTSKPSPNHAHVPLWDDQPACFSNPDHDCVTGYFLDLPVLSGLVGGASFGETVVQLYE
jgi:hypothetical protein